jgi:hypothetical protein
MSASVTPDSLRELISRAVPATALRVFHELVERCLPSWPLPQFLAAFTATARTLGRSVFAGTALAAQPELHAAARTAQSVDAAGRIWLLCTLAQAAPHKLEEAVTLAYENGDSREKLAIVRGLWLLPDAERFTRLALDAGRSNEVDLVRALACDNPFPAQHYDELAWNKLVMKAAFMELPLADVALARMRDDAELSRMALHYIEQQESATRRFPPELWLAVAAFPPPGAVAKLLGYVCHAVTEQRLAAARALERIHQRRTATFLSERASVELDSRVLTVLTRTLDALAAS